MIKEARKAEKKYGIKPSLLDKKEARVKAFFDYWQPAYFKPEFVQHGYRLRVWSFRTNLASILFYGIFLPFYILGILLLLKRKYFLGLFIAALPIIHSLLHAYMIWANARYRSTMDFIVVMIGIWSIVELYRYFVSKIKTLRK